MKWRRLSAGIYESDSGSRITSVMPPGYSRRDVWQAVMPGIEVEYHPILGLRHPTFMTLAKAKEHCEAQHEGR